MKKTPTIILAEPSVIIAEGLESLLKKQGLQVHIVCASKFDDLPSVFVRWKPNVVIINPSLTLNNQKQFQNIRNEFGDIQWIALIYAYFEERLFIPFNSRISISDSPESICKTVQQLLESDKQQGAGSAQDVLSERETDVLKLLAIGLANKEIADRLNISINTVMTHRKNITQKTGIKTISGLTIYAVVQKLIQLDDSIE